MREFSIIIPAFNGADLISRSILSVINQSYQNWELIFIDDGSTDLTYQQTLFYLSDKRIKYYYQENAGVSKARNSGVEKSNGKWLIFLDSDDELDTDALLNFNSHIDAHPDCVLFIAGNLRITSSERIINLPENGKHSTFLAGTFCLDKSVFSKAGGYDTRLRFSENTELFHRVLIERIKPSYLNDISLIYHKSECGGSKNLLNMIDSLLIILDKHQNTLTHKTKYLYHQIIGVNYMRFQNFSEARKHLWKAYKLQPTKMMTLGRLVLSYFPQLSKKMYKLIIK
ncbi:glycosyltransferase family A protein [Algoriphagus sp. Y33]|uniref:glycosyltransferase family A protein n=1 Tax=Algoriphagus sp. Y33 TaxID=2772483 RepID=UPI001785A69E|nr:glycosyltransferase family A protein [Algoriphagus sp. Y33]